MLLKKTFLFFLFLFLLTASFGQITNVENKLHSTPIDTLPGWRKGGIVNLSIAQSSFNNWAAGGQNSIAINGLVSTFLNYKTNITSWENMLDIGYGVLRQGKNGNYLKTDDKIDFSSKYGKRAYKSWFYAGLLGFKTQMSPGYNYPNDSVKISDALAPAYIVAALGMDYKVNTIFTCFIAPLTIKTTLVNTTSLADAGAFGVEPGVYNANNVLVKHGKSMRNEFGGYIRAVYKSDFFKDKSLSVLSKLELFSNYVHHPENIDISWETIIGFKVNKYISATITTHVQYDDDIKISVDDNQDGITDASGPRTQLKEVLGIGFSYKF